VSAPDLDDLLVRLKYGSAPWSAWRDEDSDTEIVLDGANLLEADLLGARLTGAR
jgi:hypothetical protein